MDALLARAAGNNSISLTDFRAHCTLSTCPIDDSYYYYRPSFPVNTAFLVIFAFSLLAYILQAALSRRFIGFSIAMICGCILEVLGYAGRIMSYNNPFDENGFLLQIVCLTIAPAFMAAGLYLTLSRIVTVFGTAHSRIAPLSYPRIFIPCDVASLMLQATGGGIASVATHQGKSPNVGSHIMVAGLALQVATLLVFMALCADFAVRTMHAARTNPGASDPRHATLRASRKFRGFLVALCVATVCIFIRSVYRVGELAEGWQGALIRRQDLFIALEGVMVIVAVLALNAFHPGWCFREGYDGPVARRGKKGADTGEKQVPSRDESNSSAT